MSRFMLQLLVEDSHHTIIRNTLQTGQVTLLQHPSPIEKSADIMDVLRRRFGRDNSDGPLLTPTAINRYMRCPLQFYFCYVEGLREPNDTEDGVIDNRIFGNIFHNAAQILYERLMQQSPRILAADLERLLKSRIDIERAVDEAFAQEFCNNAPQGGLAVINREVIIHYLRQLVTIDLRLAPFTILGLEQDVTRQMPIPSLGITTTIGGRVDRIDLISNDDNEQIRVIDYKTGTHRLQPLKTVDDIFDDTQLRNHNDYYLQAILYARIVRSSQQQPVAPALLFIQHAAAEDFNPILKFGSEYINDVATTDGDRFVQLLMQKVNEIFDPALPLTPTADTERCRNCPYAHLCGL
jgi:CRISPR/Cas system-associated exonuclease Cas4 (RecB family)